MKQLTVNWQEHNSEQTAVWQSEGRLAAPMQIKIVDDTTRADQAYKWVCEGVALLYRGDFQNAKQLLQAITRRFDRKPVKAAGSLNAAFHQHRARQIQRASITNKILVELQFAACGLPRAPDVKDAVLAALDDKPAARLLLSLRELLGMIGAHEWRKKGVYIEALQANIHAHYAVYSPVRGEYLSLINQMPLNEPEVAWDIGTGTGVIAAVLVNRGVKKVVATDNSARAIRCVSENVAQLGLKQYVSVEQLDLFPAGKADLIVCNPPWLPAKANAPIEHAIYDPNSQMLKRFLSGVKAHLTENGEAWLVMSDLAEHLALRKPGELLQWISDAGLEVAAKLDVAPAHRKAHDASDPLYAARSKEITSLYRLIATLENHTVTT